MRRAIPSAAPPRTMRALRTFGLAVVALTMGACDDGVGPLEPTAFAAVTAGGRHTCALSTGGVAYCWGAGEAGELGDGRFETSPVPRPVGEDPGFVSLSAGFRHTCGVTAGQDVFCWGWNFHGQLGNGAAVDQGLPVQIAPGLPVQQVASGWFHTCALSAAAEAYCWGSNGQGQLGDGTTTSRLAPVRVVGGHRFARLSAGGFHTCGVRTDGAVFCWGLNHQGQLGTGDVTSTNAPRRAAAPANARFGDVSAGFGHTCAIDAAGVPFCWGSNGSGELGVAFASEPGNAGSVAPVPVRDVTTPFVRIDAGHDFTCGVRVDGLGRCWGLGIDGQLGTGGYLTWVTVQPVANVDDFLTIEAGGTHACGFTRSSAILCWGRGDAGQLGNPSTPRSALPVRVPGVQ